MTHISTKAMHEVANVSQPGMPPAIKLFGASRPRSEPPETPMISPANTPMFSRAITPGTCSLGVYTPIHAVETARAPMDRPCIRLLM